MGKHVPVQNAYAGKGWYIIQPASGDGKPFVVAVKSMLWLPGCVGKAEAERRMRAVLDQDGKLR